MQDTVSAATAEFNKKTGLRHCAVEARIYTGVHRDDAAKAVSEKVNTNTARCRKHKIIGPDLLVKRLKKLRLAVALNRLIVHLHIYPFLGCLHPEHGCEHLCLFAASGMADRHARITAVHKDLFKSLDHVPDFIKRLLLAYYHNSLLLLYGLEKILTHPYSVIPACPESFFFNALRKQPIPDKPE
jgi:hypothetical protein